MNTVRSLSRASMGGVGVILALLFLSTPLVMRAQELSPVEQSADMVAIGGIIPADGASCFDYYRFGSVRAELSLPVTSVVSGSAATFTGLLHNENAYPIVDGALYVKIFRDRTISDGNGSDVVDEFLVKGGIAIPARASVPISFQWKVPAYAQSGGYTVATYFTTSRKFNLSGLSFTDDIAGPKVSFTVVGEIPGSVRFDKTTARIDARPYYFAAFPPRVASTSTVDIGVSVRNTTGKAETATVSWTVYRWDSQLRENVLYEIPAQTVSVPAQGTLPLQVAVTNTEYPVYYVVGTLRWRDTTSLVGLRFVRTDRERPRINFPGVTEYPLKAGEPVSLFSCVHNEGMAPLVEGGRLELSLVSPSGEVIHTYTYEGAISSAMMAAVDTFTPTQDHQSFFLDARLYQNEQFIDEVHLEYRCEQLQGETCAALLREEEAQGVLPTFLTTLTLPLMGMWGLFIAGVGILIVAALVVWRRVTQKVSPIVTNNDPTMVV